MAQVWRLAIAIVLVPLSLLAGPDRSERPGPRVEQIAGEYYLGHGTGVNFTLIITPTGTFSYTWEGCLGNYAEASGKAFLRNGELVLGPSSKKGDTDEVLDTRLFPLRWGGRQYLVPSDELIDFANQVNGGLEPRSEAWGDVYLRKNDWDKPVTGGPDVPERYRSYFLPKPVNARVLRKRDSHTAELGAGRDQGLLRGMELTPVSEEGSLFLCHLEVVSLKKDTAVARGDHDCEELQPGHEVSTRLFYADNP